jgi:hypothetical protein
MRTELFKDATKTKRYLKLEDELWDIILYLHEIHFKSCGRDKPLILAIFLHRGIEYLENKYLETFRDLYPEGANSKRIFFNATGLTSLDVAPKVLEFERIMRELGDDAPKLVGSEVQRFIDLDNHFNVYLNEDKEQEYKETKALLNTAKKLIKRNPHTQQYHLARFCNGIAMASSGELEMNNLYFAA